MIMPAERSADSSLGRIPSNKDQQFMNSNCGDLEGTCQRVSSRRLVNV